MNSNKTSGMKDVFEVLQATIDEEAAAAHPNCRVVIEPFDAVDGDGFNWKLDVEERDIHALLEEQGSCGLQGVGFEDGVGPSRFLQQSLQLVAGPSLASVLFGANPRDPTALGTVFAVLGIAMLAATLRPAVWAYITPPAPRCGPDA